MSEHNPNHQSVGVRTVKSHQFVTMIILVIMTAGFLVFVAMSLYQSSGTLQLDLSRPGYDNARQEATKDNEVFRGFAAEGPIDDKALNEFDRLYKEKAAEALIEIDAFSGDALSDAALSLDGD